LIDIRNAFVSYPAHRWNDRSNDSLVTVTTHLLTYLLTYLFTYLLTYKLTISNANDSLKLLIVTETSEKCSKISEMLNWF